MGKNFTRSLIMLLCISMIAALCGISAFAEDAAVAEVDGTQYASLEKAFEAVKKGGTVKLLNNVVTQAGIVFGNDLSGGNIILDLNGHDITNEYVCFYLYGSYGTFTITGKGTITSTGYDAIGVSGGRLSDAMTLNVEKDVKIVSKKASCIYADADGKYTEVKVHGTLVSEGKNAAIQGYGENISTDSKIVVYNEADISAETTAIYHPQRGSLEILGGTITGNKCSVIEMRKGSLKISGNPVITSKAGEYTVTPNGSGSTTNGAAVAIAPYDTSTMNISISGGTFTGKKALSYANPNEVANPDVTINVTGGTFSTDITDALTNADVKSNIDKLAVVKDDNGYTYSVSDAAVAEVGGEKYASLEAAFAKALTGDTITLLANAKVYSRININNGKKLTLDLGNFNIDNEHSDRLFYVKDGALTVTGQGTVTNNNNDVFVVCGNSNATTWATTAIDSVLTIGEKVKVVSGGDCCIFWQGNGAVANVYGDLTSNGIYATIQGNGSLNDKTNNGGTVLNIFPGASVKATSTATTIYHPQSGTVNVTGGTIDSAEGCGIEMRDGTLNISGDAAVISHADKYESDPNGSGATTVGAAVAIAMYGNGNRVGVLNISGGTFKGVKALSYANPNKVTNPDVTINVTGGTFNTDITDALTNAEVKSNIKEYAVAANADGTYGVKARDEKFEKVAAVQRTGSKTLTFLAGIDYLDYEKAGFRVTVGSNTKEINTDTVYTELKDNGATSVSAEKFSTNYFFAANFEVLDTSITEFTITPFAKLLNGEEVTGDSTTVKVEKTGGAE